MLPQGLLFGSPDDHDVKGHPTNFITINELLAERCIGTLGIAISDGDAAIEQDQGRNQEESGEAGCGSFHGGWCCPIMDVASRRFI